LTPRISIIICTLNREGTLRNTLRSVVTLIQGRTDAELIVVDQTRSHDQATERCFAELAGSIHLHRVDFASLTRARNHGTRHARGEIILFLDDDVEPSVNLIDEHLACYANPEVWGVGGCTLLPGKGKLSKTDLSPSELRSLDLERTNRFDLDWSRMISWAPGCNMSFRRDKLFAVGGFDEAFYGIAVGEEAELCYRVRQAGGMIQYAPEAALVHLVHPSGGCRDATANTERTAQLLDNHYYYLSRIGKTGVVRWKALLHQCRTLAFNRGTLREGTWHEWAVVCGGGLLRALQNADRKPKPGLLGAEGKADAPAR
jgi:GT2 family glycosyltransferase